MRRPNVALALALALLCCASPGAAQNVQEPEVRQAQERSAARRREAVAPRQGERIRRDQAVTGTASLGRVGNRVAGRLDTRLRTRIERTTNDGRDRIGVSREALDDNSRRR